MKRVPVSAGRPYEVLIGPGILSELGKAVLEVFAPCRLAVITDDTVAGLYLADVRETLERAGFDISVFSVPPGEASKSMDSFQACVSFLAERGLTRTDGVVALGGGVPGDLAGFAAASYLRGIGFIQIPTTLLAAVDSSVGGKTGVNLPSGKNLVGAFWQPRLVFCDTRLLRSLPPRTFSDGMAEVIKYGIIAGKSLFEELRAAVPVTAEYPRLPSLIASCVSIKAAFVAEDERDRGRRQLLNLGHTAGHGAETLSGYAITHGEAVAAGMAVMARACFRLGYTDRESVSAICDVIEKQGFSLTLPFSARELLPVILKDKKRGGSQIFLVLPLKIGRAELRPFPVHSLEELLRLGLEPF